MSKKTFDPSKLVGHEKTVYGAMHLGKPVQTHDLSSATGLSMNQVASACYCLRQKGLVRSVKTSGVATDARNRPMYLHEALPAPEVPQKQSALIQRKRGKKKERRSIDRRLVEAMGEMLSAANRLAEVVQEAQEAIKAVEQLKAIAKNF